MLWSPNCQLLYPFENQANDYSGNARHGTVFGSGVYATKPNGGRCLYFDGVGDYVKTPSFGLSGTVVVFTCWVRCKKQPAAPDYQHFFMSPGTGHIEFFRLKNNDDLKLEYVVGTVSATNYFAAPFNDVWLCLCVAIDYTGKVAYFYRNGLLFSSVALGGTPVFPSGVSGKFIGSYSATLYLLTDGYLAGVQLWTLATMPAAGQMLANVNRLMLGMNPIW